MAMEQVGVEATLKGFNEYVRQIRELVKETQKAGGSLEQTADGANKAGGAVDKAGRSFGSSAKQILQFGAAIAGVQLGIAGVQSAFGNTIGAAIKFEQAFTGVVKTVDGTDAQLAALEKGIRGLAKTTPIAATELANVASAAGQLGIATDDILDFTKIVADLGVATNLSTEEAAFALARFSNITNLATEDLDNMGAAIVDLGNNSATTERDIVEFGLRIAGAGTQIGLTQAEILAFGAALSSVGLEAEAGGTAISRVFVEVDKAVRTGSDSLDLFAEVAGMSAQEFTRAYEQDAARAIVSFIEGLRNISDAGGDTFGILEDLEFGNLRVRDALLRASNAGDLLRASLDRGNQAWEENTALTKEANLFYGTTENQIKLLRNQIVDAGISLGNVFLPAINDGVGFLSDFVEAAAAGEGAAGLLADVLPSVAVALGAIVAVKAAFAIFEFAEAAASAVTKLSRTQLAIGGVVGAFLALDTALRAVTGKGLVERVVDLFNKTDKAAEAATKSLDNFDRARRRAFQDFDFAAQAARDLDLAFRGLNQQFDRIENLAFQTGTFNELKIAAEELGGAAGGIAAGMDAAGASSLELSQYIGDLRVRALEAGREFGLTGDILQFFVDTVVQSATDNIPGWTEVVDEAAAAAADLAGETDFLANSVRDQVKAQESAARSTGILSTAIDTAGPGVLIYRAALEEGKKSAEAFASALAALTSQFFATNPAVIDLQAQSAVLASQIADLEAKTGDLTEAEEERLKALKEQKSEVDAQISSYAAQEAAIAPLIKEIQRLTGATNEQLLSLQQGLSDAGVSGQAAVKILDDLQAALDLEDTEAIAAIGRIYDALEEQLGPEAAQAVIAEINPILVERFTAAEPTVRAEAGNLGILTADQFVLGADEWFDNHDGPALAKAVEDTGPDVEAAASEAGSKVGPAFSGAITPSDFEQVGLAAGEGIRSGIDQTDFSAAAQRLVDKVLGQFRFLFKIASPSQVMADEIGEPLALGIVQGLIGGLRESDIESAMQAFVNSLSIETGFAQLEAQFGKAGGDVAIAFTRALADNTERTGEQLTKSVLSLIEAATEAGVPNAQQLGANLITALTDALRTGEPALVQTALDLLDHFTTTIEVASQGAGVSLIDSFLDGYNGQVRDRKLVENVGKTGADIIKGLRDGLESESPSVLTRVGVLADGLIQQLQTKLGNKKAAEPARILMDAIATAIREGTPEAEAALVEVLAILDDVLNGNFGALRDLSAETIPGAVTTGINQGKPKAMEAVNAFGTETLEFFYKWQIDLQRGLAEGTAMSTTTLYEGLMNMKTAILESGLDDESKNMATGIIDGFITALEDGKGLANEALLAFIAELLETARKGDPDSKSAGTGEKPGSGGDGSAPASTRGQTFREQAETLLGFNPFAKDVVQTSGGFSETVYTEGSLTFRAGKPLTEGDLITRLIRGDLIDWIEDGRIKVNKYDRGTPFVPQDQLALVHRGEAIIPEAYNPWAYLPARGDVGMGNGGTEIIINVEFNNTQFTGTPDENEAMMRSIFREEMQQQLGNGAFLHGFRS